MPQETRAFLHSICLFLFFVFFDLTVGFGLFPAKNFFRLWWIEKSILSFVFFVFVIFFCYFAVFLSINVKGTRFRYLSWFWVLVCYFIFLAFKEVNGYGFESAEARLILDFVGNVNCFPMACTAALHFFPLMLMPLLKTTAFVLFFPLSRPLFNHRHLLQYAIALCLALVSIVKTNGVCKLFPVPVGVPVYFLAGLVNPRLQCDRAEPRLKASKAKRLADKIFLVVDESIRGDMLSINNFALETTPTLASNSFRIHNFGCAVSGGNSSFISNLILLSGIREHEIPDREQKAFRTPSIFQYAQAAGYTTFLINSQALENELDYLRSTDLKAVSQQLNPITLPDTPTWQLDLAGLHQFNEIFSQAPLNTSFFTYFIKIGAHYAYESRYPVEARRFTPVMDGKNAYDKEKLQNSYLNALTWSVDRFFQEYFRIVDGNPDQWRDVVMLYTSDHGQNLLDDGTLTPSNSSFPSRHQAIVPLILVFSCAERKKSFLELFPVTDRSKASGSYTHFQIFPTLLTWFGYDPTEVAENHGDTLAGPPIADTVFYSGDFTGFSPCQRNVVRPELEP